MGGFSYGGSGTGNPVNGITFGGVTGQYLQLKLPKAIKVDSIFFNSYQNPGTPADNRRPTEGTFLGSNDGSNWESIHTFNAGDITWTDGPTYGEKRTTLTNITNTNYYSYIVFVIEKISLNTTYGALIIQELEYYGYEEDPPLGDTPVDTTFTSIMNTPQTTGAHVYADGSIGGNAHTNRVVGPAAAYTAA